MGKHQFVKTPYYLINIIVYYFCLSRVLFYYIYMELIANYVAKHQTFAGLQGKGEELASG